MIRAGKGGSGRRIINGISISISTSISNSSSFLSHSLSLSHPLSQPSSSSSSSFSTTSHPSSYKPSFCNPRATKPKPKRKKIPNWKAEERSLRSELSSLEQRLNILDKREKSDLIEKDLPPLDEASLDQIHNALMLPTPASPQEARLANHALKRRIANANLQARTLLASDSKSHPQDPNRIEFQNAFNAISESQVLSFNSDRDLPAPSENTQDEIDFSPPSTSHLTRSQLVALRLKTFSDRLQSISNASSLGVGTSQEGRMASEVEEKRREISRRLKALIQSKKQSELEEAIGEEDLEQGVGEDPAETSEISKDSLLESDLRKIKAENREMQTGDQITPTSQGPTTSAQHQSSIGEPSNTSHSILNRLETLILSSENMSEKGKDVEGLEKEESELLPMGFATPREWTALAVSFAQNAEDENLSKTLELMKRSGYKHNIELFNDVMDCYAESGDVVRCEEILSYVKTIGLIPSDHTIHALVKSHVRSNQMTSALNLLSNLEDAATPASLATYTLVMDSLLKNPSLPIQSLSWNLFYHMRLSAHPIPDVPVYSMMMRACAKGIPQPNEIEDLVSEEKRDSRLPDAERALDLFKEMTERYNLRPNVEIYNSLILTCSKRKDYIEEAWRLFREMCMLEEERISADRQKREASQSRLSQEKSPFEEGEEPIYLRYSPDRHTFNALIAGCAREKDLHRARWLLAEMLRATSPLYDGGAQMDLQLGLLDEESLLDMMDKRPDEETISWILRCYASFRAPLKRSEMRLKEQQEKEKDQEQEDYSEKEQQQQQEKEAHQDKAVKPGVSDETGVGGGGGMTDHLHLSESSTHQESKASQIPTDFTSQTSKGPQDVSPSSFTQAADDAVSAFTYAVPQTSAEVINEVRGLMARIIADQPTSPDDRPGEVSRFGKGPLSNVRITPKVINSYLAVHSQHLPHSQRLEWHAENVGIDLSLPNQFSDSSPSTSTLLSPSESDLFTQFNVARTGHTHLLSLELASTASIKDPINRSSVEIISFEAFKSFRSLEELADEQGWDARLRKHWGVDTQTIREVWSARIRALTKLGRLRQAFKTLESFTQKYPPPSNRDSKDVTIKKTKKSQVKPPPALVMGALVPSPTSISALRAFETSTHPPNQPLLKFETPYFTFQDLELLYHRLTVMGSLVSRAWVQYIIHAYSGRGEARKERYRQMRMKEMEKQEMEARRQELEEIEKQERKQKKAERRARRKDQALQSGAGQEEIQLRIINTSEGNVDGSLEEERLVEDVDVEDEMAEEEEGNETPLQQLPDSLSSLGDNTEDSESYPKVDFQSLTPRPSRRSVAEDSL